jgi:hypothetical protein
LREFADYGDTHRRTADQVIDALTEAGMFRLVTPRRYNGYEVDLVTLLDLTEILGEADGSAAWLVGIAATLPGEPRTHLRKLSTRSSAPIPTPDSPEAAPAPAPGDRSTVVSSSRDDGATHRDHCMPRGLRPFLKGG